MVKRFRFLVFFFAALFIAGSFMMSIGSVEAKAVSATSAWQLNNDKTDDGIWTMPVEVHGTYCIKDWGNNGVNGTTELGNPTDNVTFSYTPACDICKDSTMDITLSCAEIPITGCGTDLYLVGDNGSGTIVPYAQTVAPCSQPVSTLNMKFVKQVDNSTGAYPTLYLSTQPDKVVTPAVCFNGGVCHKSFIESSNTKNPSGGAETCADTAKATFAQFVEQFKFGNGNEDGWWDSTGPEKSIIAMDGMCPRCSFAGPSENVPSVFGDCCDDAYYKFHSVDAVRLCDFYYASNNILDDPIHLNDGTTAAAYLDNVTMSYTATNKFVGVTGITFANNKPEDVIGTFEKTATGYALTLTATDKNLIDCDHYISIAVDSSDNCSSTPLEGGDFILTTQFNFKQKSGATFTLSHPAATTLTHRWVFNGWEGTTPYMSVFNGYKTFAKIFNDYVKSADVYVDVFPDNGTPVYNVKLGTIPAKQVKIFWASDIAAKAGIDTTTYPTFAVKFVVTAPPSFVHGVVVQKSPDSDRVMPIDKPIEVYSGAIPTSYADR